MGAGSAQKQQQGKNMTEEFMTHCFNKVCTEARRGDGTDEMIRMDVTKNIQLLRRLIDSENYTWLGSIIDIDAVFFALSQLQAYYGGGAVSHEQWALAGFYSHTNLKKLDIELSSSDE
jgi:hypothetical protein